MVVHHVTGSLLENEPSWRYHEDKRKSLESMAIEINECSIALASGVSIAEIWFEEDSDSTFSIAHIRFSNGKKECFFGLEYALGYLDGLLNGIKVAGSK